MLVFRNGRKIVQLRRHARVSPLGRLYNLKLIVNTLLPLTFLWAIKAFPEVDRAAWFDLATARKKILPGQLPISDELVERLGQKAAAE